MAMEGIKCPSCGKVIHAKVEGSQYTFTCPDCGLCPTSHEQIACNKRIKEERGNVDRRKTRRSA